ncbi:hypothetical protein AB0M44_22425 [Streptosporangium subroseum]|uniref:hypothetical protein n=1 Tax=Streptosporangium subroseum TaxID=106412 RepID=UPI0034450FD9
MSLLGVEDLALLWTVAGIVAAVTTAIIWVARRDAGPLGVALTLGALGYFSMGVWGLVGGAALLAWGACVGILLAGGDRVRHLVWRLVVNPGE